MNELTEVDGVPGLRICDVRYMEYLLSPEYIIAAAKSYGKGDAVEGAKEAYDEVRVLLRQYIRYIRWRERKFGKKDLKLAQALRGMGYIENYSPVVDLGEEVDSDWKAVAEDMWLAWPGPTNGWLEMTLEPHITDSALGRAVIIAVSQMLDEVPEVNRCCLQGKTYRRTDSNVMVPVKLPRRGSTRTIIHRAHNYTHHKELYGPLKRSVAQASEADKHPLKPVSRRLLRKWLRAGFIASPAGASVSPVGSYGIPNGLAPIVPGNGIPIVIVVSRIEPETRFVRIRAAVDHRVFEVDEMGTIYEFLEERIPTILEGDKRALKENKRKWKYEKSTRNRRFQGKKSGQGHRRQAKRRRT